MQLRKKILLGSLIAIVLLVTIIGLFLENTQSSLILQSMETQMLKSLHQSAQLLDVRLSEIPERVTRMSTDGDLYRLFASDFTEAVGDNSPTSTFKRLFYSYFSDLQSVLDINLVSDHFTHSLNQRSNYTKRDFQTAGLFGLFTAQFPYDGWMPSQTLSGHVNPLVRPLSYYKKLQQSRVFRYVRLLNISTVIDNNIVVLEKKIDTPYLVLDIEPAFFDTILQDMLLTPQSGYGVYSAFGEPITLSEHAAPLSPEQVQMLEPDMQTSITIASDGQTYRLAALCSEVNGWIYCLSIPLSDLRQMTGSTKLMLLIMIVGLTTLTIGCLWLYIAYSVKPVENAARMLEQTVSAYASNAVPLTSHDEAKRISVSLVELNRRIESLMKENSSIAHQEQEATILALETQINPHFLYNALNRLHLLAIRHGDNELANSILQLAGLFRSQIDSKMHAIFLHQELVQLKQYAAAMNADQEDRFFIYYDIDPELMDSIVPKMFLQPFVENAILHGFRHMRHGGVIRIQGWIEQNKAVYTVEDNGQGISPAKLTELFQPTDHPSGFLNVNERIRLLYGEAFGVSVTSDETGTQVRIVLPLLME